MAPDVFESSRAFAKQRNQMFSQLQPGDPCEEETGTPACIGGDNFRCTDRGVWELSERCPAGTTCEAVPWEFEAVIRVGCIDPQEAKRLLGEGGDGVETGKTPKVPTPSATTAPQPEEPKPETPEPEYPEPGTPEQDTPEPDVSEPVTTTTKTSTSVIIKTTSRPSPSTIAPTVPEVSDEPQAPAYSDPPTNPDPPANPEPPVNPEPTTQAAPPAVPETFTTQAPAPPAPEPTSDPIGSTTVTNIINNDDPGMDPFWTAITEVNLPQPDPTGTSDGDDGFGTEQDDQGTNKTDQGSGEKDINQDIVNGDDGNNSEGDVNQEEPSFEITQTIGGMPTVSLYFTITETVTEKERETVTLIVPN